MPFLLQPIPRDISWGALRLYPTNDQHLHMTTKIIHGKENISHNAWSVVGRRWNVCWCEKVPLFGLPVLRYDQGWTFKASWGISSLRRCNCREISPTWEISYQTPNYCVNVCCWCFNWLMSLIMLIRWGKPHCVPRVSHLPAPLEREIKRPWERSWGKPRLRAVPVFAYSPSRAERKKQAARKLATRKLLSGRKAKKKGLQTTPQRLTYALLPQRKNAIG